MTDPEQLPLPAAAQSLNIDTNVPIGTDQYIQIQSYPITVNPGDTILVTLERASNDLYAAEVGIMRPVGVIKGAISG